MKVHNVNTDFDFTTHVPGSEPCTDLIASTIQSVFPHAGRPETVREACQTVVDELSIMAATGNMHHFNYFTGRIKNRGQSAFKINGVHTLYRWHPHADEYQLMANGEVVDLPWSRTEQCIIRDMYTRARCLNLVNKANHD